MKRTSDNFGEEYEGLLISQTLEISNQQLGFWRESLSRKIKFFEEQKIYFFNGQEEVRMARSSPNTLTPLDILGDYLDKKTTFKNDYPNSDKNVSIPLL